MIDFDKLRKAAGQLRAQWDSATPFPHVVIDDVLPLEGAVRLDEGFTATAHGWVFHSHYNERKYCHSKKELMAPAIREFLADVESPPWLRFLEEVTGIPKLIADPSLDGSSGLHRSLPGCYLNFHRESATHNVHSDWDRKLNMLLYLNKEWNARWGGELEFMDHRTGKSVKKVAPIFNRMVIFRTNEVAYHGNPNTLTCPDGVVRKSLALYYFTREQKRFWLKPVLYRPEAADGLSRRLRIALDNLALRVYFPLRKYTPIDDKMVERAMRFLRITKD